MRSLPNGVQQRRHSKDVTKFNGQFVLKCYICINNLSLDLRWSGYQQTTQLPLFQTAPSTWTVPSVCGAKQFQCVRCNMFIIRSFGACVCARLQRVWAVRIYKQNLFLTSSSISGTIIIRIGELNWTWPSNLHNILSISLMPVMDIVCCPSFIFIRNSNVFLNSVLIFSYMEMIGISFV